MNEQIIATVHRKKNKSAKVFEIIMITLAAFFLVMGIAISRGFMLPCFMMAGLYFLYSANTQKDYEYILKDNILTIDIIKNHHKRSNACEINLENMEILAPCNHEIVKKYKKGSENANILKYDYTSYDDEIPYYTMIITENGQKIKLLLDINDEMMDRLTRKYAQKVYQ